ncbi:hypothetical protein [Paraburkholderia sp. CI3]|uniref:hypothetical protein n=1 Tax=Paraburkholderia sp. CI3 TaxID=2991060 RepID=UPI003D1CF2C2
MTVSSMIGEQQSLQQRLNKIHRGAHAPLSTPAASDAHIASHERPLAGYLAGRARLNRIPDPEALAPLREAQRTLTKARTAFPMGRGNVIPDLLASQLESYVTLTAGRRLAVQIAAALSRPDDESLAIYRLGIRDHLMEDIIAGVEQKTGHPLDAARRYELTGKTAVIAMAKYGGAGNCGEMALIAASMHANTTDDGSRVYEVNGSPTVDHGWAEERKADGSERPDDIIIDPWLEGPVTYREDASIAASANWLGATPYHSESIPSGADELATALQNNPEFRRIFDLQLKKAREDVVGFSTLDFGAFAYSPTSSVSERMARDVRAAKENDAGHQAFTRGVRNGKANDANQAALLMEIATAGVNRAFGLNVRDATDEVNNTNVLAEMNKLNM